MDSSTSSIRLKSPSSHHWPHRPHRPSSCGRRSTSPGQSGGGRGGVGGGGLPGHPPGQMGCAVRAWTDRTVWVGPCFGSGCTRQRERSRQQRRMTFERDGDALGIELVVHCRARRKTQQAEYRFPARRRAKQGTKTRQTSVVLNLLQAEIFDVNDKRDLLDSRSVVHIALLRPDANDVLLGADA